MTQRQLEFWDRNDESTEHLSDLCRLRCEAKQIAEALVRNETEYVSLKRVSVVHDGTVRTRPRLTSTEEALQFFGRYWSENPGNDQERFVVACLDTKNHVQCVVVVTIGSLDASLVHPREVFKPAIIEGSSSVILSHNHPSGDTTPSNEDRTVTERLTKAGQLLGIEVLDHIIHGDSSGKLLSMRTDFGYCF